MTRLPLSMLVGYDANDVVTNTLESCPFLDELGRVIGLIDFEANELAGVELTDIWRDSAAVGSKTWPEWFEARGWSGERTGRPGRKRLTALIHPVSGHRRERAAIEAEVERRIQVERDAAHAAGEALRAELIAEGIDNEPVLAFVTDPEPEPTDLRDLLGGPDSPLQLDDEGRNATRAAWSGSPKHLRLVGGGRLDDAEQPGAGAEGDGGSEPEIGVTVAVAPGQ